MVERASGPDYDPSTVDEEHTAERPFIDPLEELAFTLKSYQQAREILRAAQEKKATGQQLSEEESRLLESL